MSNTITTAALIKMAKKAVELVEADRDHRYRVTADWYVGRFKVEVPDFHGKRFWIKDGYLFVRKTPDGEKPAADGATMIPDVIVVDLAPGHIPHDLGYDEMEEMARDKAWQDAGWTVESIRRLWDGVFGCIIKAQAQKVAGVKRLGVKALAHALYAGVRVLGGIGHAVYKWLALVAVCLFVSGCVDGCAIDDVFDPSDEPPPYVVEQAGNTPGASADAQLPEGGAK